jgi:hypothetical protein
MEHFEDIFTQDLDEINDSIHFKEKNGPFIKGEDLDFNDTELADELYNYPFVAPVPKKEN